MSFITQPAMSLKANRLSILKTLPEARIPEPGKDHVLKSISLPPGLSFKLMFTQPIDTADDAAGDTIRAKLKTAIGDKASMFWFQKVLV